MPFRPDPQYAQKVGGVFGDYLTTYTSTNGQVRAVLFRKGGRVEAHVSFPRFVFASGVTEPYYSELWQYARQQGYADNFQIILSWCQGRIAMPQMQVRIVLPYYLRLEEGDYQTTQAGEAVHVDATLLLEGIPPRTPIHARFAHEDTEDIDEIQRQRVRDVEQLVRRSNRLLRWYRAVSRRADIIEITRAQASPFQFTFIGPAAAPEWALPFAVEAAGPQPVEIAIAQMSQSVRDGLVAGNDPDVAELFLLDAERALYQGRFRETVLFCWSTIDSVFNRKYDALIDVALAGEWAESRRFFTGVDFGLKNKMTAALFLVSDRSLFRQPGDFWERLRVSYDKRNAIIHRGQNANEDEARQAIDIAQRVVAIMNEIAVPAPHCGWPSRSCAGDRRSTGIFSRSCRPW
jgi:hypothetical protein